MTFIASGEANSASRRALCSRVSTLGFLWINDPRHQRENSLWLTPCLLFSCFYLGPLPEESFLSLVRKPLLARASSTTHVCLP
jgi:hypothetical protein